MWNRIWTVFVFVLLTTTFEEFDAVYINQKCGYDVSIYQNILTQNEKLMEFLE